MYTGEAVAIQIPKYTPFGTEGLSDKKSDYPYIKNNSLTTFHWLAADGRCYKVGSSESQKPFEAPCQWCQWQSRPDHLGDICGFTGKSVESFC